MDEQRFEIVTGDLMGDWDESQFDRLGAPITVDATTVTPGDQPVEAVPQRHTLADLAVDHEFFTPGVILAASPFDRDPVSEALQRLPHLAPMAIDAAEPFFSGLGVHTCADGPVNFDHRLYLIPRDDWESLRDCIAGIAMVSQAEKFYGRVNFYETTLPDIFAIKQKVVLESIPQVPLTVFGVSSTKMFAYLEPHGNLLRLVKAPPRPEADVELQNWI